MKKNLEAQHKELEEKRRVFEEERANWEALQRQEQLKQEASKYEQLSPLTHGAGLDFQALRLMLNQDEEFTVTRLRLNSFNLECVPARIVFDI